MPSCSVWGVYHCFLKNKKNRTLGKQNTVDIRSMCPVYT